MLLKTYMYKGREVSVYVNLCDGKFWCSTPYIPIPMGGGNGYSTMSLAVDLANVAIDRANAKAPSTYGELAEQLSKAIRDEEGNPPWLVVRDVERLVEAFLKEREKNDSDVRWIYSHDNEDNGADSGD